MRGDVSIAGCEALVLLTAAVVMLGWVLCRGLV